MPRSHSSSSSLENTVANNLRYIHLGVTDFSHHNEYNLTGNTTFNQIHGAVYNQTTYHIHHPAPKLPPLPRCPAPCANYTPREAIESHICSYFFSDRLGMKRYVLLGPGGTGKTELGLNFVDKYCYTKEADNKLFDKAHWIDATTEETIGESFKAIGLSRGVGPKTEDVLRSLASDEANWIVVFNNADNPKLDLTRYFPKCSHGNILITTRNYHARRYGVGPGSDYGVSEMTADEALALFRSHARLFEDTEPSVIETAKVLVEEVGRVALAVTQAGAYISTSLCSLSQYRDLYHDQRRELLRRHEEMHLTDDYPYRSLHATWMLSYTKLSDPAKELIQMFSCVHHEGIKEAMFSETCSGGISKLKSECEGLFTESEKAGLAKLMKHCESLLTNGRWDAMKFREIIGELRSYSLVGFDSEEGSCSVHPLVHEWTGSICDVEERAVLRQCTILLLGSSLAGFDTSEELASCRALVFHVDRIFESVGPESSACGGRFGRAYAEAGRWHFAVVHLELFRGLCGRLLGEEHMDTLTWTSNLASIYLKLGRRSDAEKLQLQVMKRWKRILGPEHPSTLISMNNLASTYSESGRPSDAEKLQLPIMKAWRRILGPEHYLTLTSMNNLGLTYSALGRWSDAEKLQLPVMEIQTRILGPEHPSRLASMNNLASTYSALGRWSDAEKLQLQVVEAQKRILGLEHPDTLTSMHNLASTYSELGRLSDAKKLQLQVMEARKKGLGPEHPHTLISMNDLASTYLKLGWPSNAEKLQLPALKALKKTLGPEHPSTLTSMSNLASTYSELGRPSDAEKLQFKVVEARKRILGPRHPSTLISMSNLAAAYLQLGRPSDAEKLQLQVVEAQKKILGPEHPFTLTSMSNLASTYSELGRPSDAEELQLLVMDALKRILGPEHPSTLTSISNLASTYSELGRPSDAERLQLPVTEALKKVLGPEHPSTLTAMSNLAFTYLELERPSDAEKLHLSVMETKKRMLGPEHPDTLTSMRNLALTYSALGRHSDAEKLQLPVMEAQKRILGPEHPDTLTSMHHLTCLRRVRDNLAGLSQSTLTPSQPELGADHLTTLSNSELLPRIETRQRTGFFSFFCCFNCREDMHD